MCNEILTNMRERDYWLTRFTCNKEIPEYYQNYCKLRNKVQRDIKKAKQNYMSNQIFPDKMKMAKVKPLF